MIEYDIIKTLVTRFPAVIPHLTGKARWIAFADGGEYKTYEFFLNTMERLITNVYNGFMQSEFLDITANLISGQLTQAFQQAWLEEGGGGELPAYLQTALFQLILEQFPHVDGLYRDIVSARELEQPLSPLLARASMWANRYNEAYNQASQLIIVQNGGKMQWVMGQAEHCETCLALNGIVAFASEWQASGLRPQGAMLQCGGFHCQCSLIPTDRRRSPKALDRLLKIAGR